MASYTTPDDVRAALSPDGTPTTGSGAEEDDTAFAGPIADATAQVDGALRHAYTVPFADPVPTLIKGVTRDIAAYLAFLTFLRADTLDPTHAVALRYNRAVQLLNDLASGHLELPIDVLTGSGASKVNNLWAGKLFDMEDFSIGVQTGRRGQKANVTGWDDQRGGF